MLFSQRKRQAEIIQRTEAGENMWVEEFPIRFRNQLIFAMNESSDYIHIYYEAAQYELLRTYGKTSLSNRGMARTQDLQNFILNCTTDELADCIEVFIAKLNDRNLSSRTYFYGGSENFEIEIKHKLLDNLISYDLIDGIIVPRGEHQLYSEVIEPVLEYLSTRHEFKPAKNAYLEGLEQIKQKNAPNAITDFATSLSEMLKAVGAKGHVLSVLKSSAINLGVLSGHDGNLIDWIAAERNSGEAHNDSSRTIDDAWLHAHITAPLILRLSKSTPRKR